MSPDAVDKHQFQLAAHFTLPTETLKIRCISISLLGCTLIFLSRMQHQQLADSPEVPKRTINIAKLQLDQST
jgi:hypothetical protein